MSAEAFSEHLQFPQGKGLAAAGASIGVAGGAACGDLISLSLRVEGSRVAAAGFEAHLIKPVAVQQLKSVIEKVTAGVIRVPRVKLHGTPRPRSA